MATIRQQKTYQAKAKKVKKFGQNQGNFMFKGKKINRYRREKRMSLLELSKTLNFQDWDIEPIYEAGEEVMTLQETYKIVSEGVKSEKQILYDITIDNSESNIT